MIEVLRSLGPPILALAATVAVDRLMERRGLVPPYFQIAGRGDRATGHAIRRALGGLGLFLLFWFAVFAPLAGLGGDRELDLEALSWPVLFMVHMLLLAALAWWHLCGFVPLAGERRRAGSDPGSQYGLRTPNLAADLGLGLAAGALAWLAVILLMVAAAGVLWGLGGEEILPNEPPAIVPWLVSLPLGLRLAVSASAGFFEELFFRGFLQPRVGVVFSTMLFVLAHAGYEQPLMLVGVTFLSLVFAYLVRLRQSIWPAVVAHALFDAIQLTIVIPKALDMLESVV